MKTPLILLATCSLLASCDTRVNVPPAEGDKTTIVNPPAKTEKTTVVTPPASSSTTTTTTTEKK
jgi:hypothetical protein